MLLCAANDCSVEFEIAGFELEPSANGKTPISSLKRSSMRTLSKQKSPKKIVLGKAQPLTDVLPAGEMLRVLRAFQKGDFTLELPTDEYSGVGAQIASVLNDVIGKNRRLAEELARVSRVVGKEGKLSQRAQRGDVDGCWASSIESVNTL